MPTETRLYNCDQLALFFKLELSHFTVHNLLSPKLDTEYKF